MRKIHHGFTALAILMGPASVIIAHQKISDFFQQEQVSSSDPAAVIRQVYAYCSELPGFQRPSGCDEYLDRFEQCAALKERCDPHSVYKVLTRLSLSPVPSEMPKIDKVAVTDDEQERWRSMSPSTAGPRLLGAPGQRSAPAPACSRSALETPVAWRSPRLPRQSRCAGFAPGPARLSQ